MKASEKELNLSLHLLHQWTAAIILQKMIGLTVRYCSVFHLPILSSWIYVGIFKKVHKRQRTDYATDLGIIHHVPHYLMFTW